MKSFVLQRYFSQVTSRDGNPWKTRVFRFIGLMWQIFKHIPFSLTLPPSCLSQPKALFQSKTQSNFKRKPLQIYSKVCHTIFSLYFLRLCRKFLGFSWIRYFRKRVGNLWFCKKNFNFLIWLYPIWFVCVCVGPLWHFNMYLGNFHSCSCIAHMLVVLVHIKYLIKCSNGILMLFWTPMSSKLWGLPWLNLFIMFWSLVACFTHFDPIVLKHALLMHFIGTPRAHLMHTFAHSSCFAYHSC